MPRDRPWVEDLRAQRPRLLYRRAALAAAEVAGWKEREALDIQHSSLAKEVERLETDLYRLKKRMRQVESSQKEAVSRYDTTTTGLTETEAILELINNAGLPIQELPSDVIRLIMEHAAGEDAGFRWVAMSVCKDWQAIARTTPSLWSHVDIPFNFASTDFLRRTRQAIAFGGEGSLQLRLNFDPDPFKPVRTPSAISERYRGPSKPRISRVQWFLDKWDPGFGSWDQDRRSQWESTGDHELTWDYLSIAIPQLHRCSALLWQLCTDSNYSWTWDACWIGRQLDSIDLSRLNLLRVDLSGIVPRTNGHHEQAIQTLCRATVNLRHLAMRHSLWYPVTSTSLKYLSLIDCCPSLDDLLACLADQKHLQVLKLWHVFPHSGPYFGRGDSDNDNADSLVAVPASAMVTLPQLEEFFHSPNTSCRREEAALLGRLRCPRLHRAIIKGHGWHEGLSQTISFFLNAPYLEQLAIGLIQPVQLQLAFESLSSVREFVGICPDRGFGRSPYTTFFEAASSPEALPALQRVSLRAVCEKDALLSWLEKRVRNGRPIQSFYSRWKKEPTLFCDEELCADLESHKITWRAEIDWPYYTSDLMYD